MEFLRETHTALALRQGRGVSVATATDDASMPRRGSVSLANGHLDGLSIDCIHAERGAVETDNAPKSFRLKVKEHLKSLGRYKRLTTFIGMRRAA